MPVGFTVGTNEASSEDSRLRPFALRVACVIPGFTSCGFPTPVFRPSIIVIIADDAELVFFFCS